jgi:hypothetical protein
MRFLTCNEALVLLNGYLSNKGNYTFSPTSKLISVEKVPLYYIFYSNIDKAPYTHYVGADGEFVY